MAMLQQVQGVTIAGFGSLPLHDNETEFQPSQQEYELVAGMNPGDGGFIRKSNDGAVLDMTLNWRQGLDIQALNAMTDVMVTITMIGGDIHVMSSACCTKAIKSGKDGKLKVEFKSATSTAR